MQPDRWMQALWAVSGETTARQRREHGPCPSRTVAALTETADSKVTAAEIYGFSMSMIGDSSSESDPMVIYQISRRWTPRARATEPGLDGVQAGPLRAPQPRAREKTRDRKEKVLYSGKRQFYT